MAVLDLQTFTRLFTEEADEVTLVVQCDSDGVRSDCDHDDVHNAVGVDGEDVMLAFSDSPVFDDDADVDCAPGSYVMSPAEARLIAEALVRAADRADELRNRSVGREVPDGAE